MLRSSFVLVAVLWALAHATLAWGKTKPDPIEQARTHFKAGEAHFQAGRYDDAIREYQAAWELSHRPALLFNIGSAHRKKAELGGVDEKRAAIDHYLRYLEAEPGGPVAAYARGFIDSLEREIEATPPVPPSPTPVAAPPPLPPPAIAPPPASPVVPLEARRANRGLRVAGYVTAAAGVALVATGVYFALRVKSVNEDLAGLAPGESWSASRYDSGRAAQRNALLFGGAGAAAIAGGAVLVVVGSF